jgi:hypothetical protein
MGGSLSRLWSFFWTKKEIRILILGLVRVLRALMLRAACNSPELRLIRFILRRTMPEKPHFFTDLRYASSA